MGLFDKFKKNKPEEEQLPFIERVDIAKMMKEREKKLSVWREKFVSVSCVTTHQTLLCCA